MKKRLLGAKNGRVVIECKPKAAPRPDISWSKGTELLLNSSRSAGGGRAGRGMWAGHVGGAEHVARIG